MKYIGQSVNIHKRWLEHKRELNKRTHHNNHLQNAWNKYGEHNFIFRVIELCDKESLDYLEQLWVSKLKTLDRNFGYNIGTPGNCCMRNRKHTKESRKKMSVWRKEHTRGKLNGFYGKKHTRKTLDKISQLLKGKFAGENNPMYGKPSPMRGKKMPIESRKKMVENHANFSGENHPRSKLKEQDVKQIIEMLLNGEKSKDISIKFNVSKSCIDGIRSHKNWKYLTKGINFKHRLAETTISQSERIKV